MALSTGTATIARGASGTADITLTRTGGFNGSVAFTATGAPAGMTVSFNPANTAGNTSVATVTVGTNVAIQNHTLTITATSGTITRTANLVVTVTAGSTGGGTTYRICSASPVLFAAGQDGTGNWQALTVTNGTVNFNVASGRGGIAYVTQSGTAYNTTYVYGTATELNQAAGTTCTTTVPGTKALSGSVANVGLTEIANIAVGSATTSVAGAAGTTFNLTNVTDGTTDALGFRLAQTISGAGFVITSNRGIIRRGVNYTGTIPVFDFAAGESFATTARTLTVNNLGADPIIFLSASFLTARSVTTAMHVETNTGGGATRQIPTVPTPQAGELHSVAVAAGTSTAGRFAQTYFQGSADRAVTLGPAPGAVTVTQAATTPSLRLRAQYTIQAEYNRGVGLTYSQATRVVSVSMTQGYLNNSTTFDHTLPELTGLTGFPAAAALVAGSTVNWGVSGFNFTGTGLPADGTTLTFFTRNGTI
jgi:hypothetical protein